MPEVTPFPSELLPGGISLWETPVEASPHTGSRRAAEREAVNRLIRECFGPEVTLAHDPDGAPRLDPAPDSTWISISHSPTTAWLAVSTAGPVGIDAELPREQLKRVAQRFLAPTEAALSPDLDGLLDLWTAKEAVYKAALTPGLDPRVIVVDNDMATLPDGREFRLSYLRRGLTLALPAEK